MTTSKSSRPAQGASPITALTAYELIFWVERTSEGWRELIERHPHVLDLPCDVRETSSVRGLLQHIAAVELRYAERLAGLPETAYEAIGTSPAELYAVHARAMSLINERLADQHYDWEQPIEFVTRSAGAMRASRRTILVHTLMHSVRHYAQLATLVRQHGVQAGWPMDYLFMSSTPV